MNAVEMLRSKKKELRRFGVKRIGIFGSFVRGEQSKGSDVDVIVEFEKGKGTFKNFAGLVNYLENLFKRPVDILTPAGLDSIRIRHIREEIRREIVYV